MVTYILAIPISGFVKPCVSNSIKCTGSGSILTTSGVTSQFYYPFGVAVDTSGGIYVADGYNKRIRKI